MNYKINVIIPAAGKGTRAEQGMNKVYKNICGRPLLVHSVLPFFTIPQVTSIIFVISIEDLGLFERLVLNDPDIRTNKERVKFITGGRTRQESVLNGLKMIEDNADLVAVHDGARPLANIDLIKETFNLANKNGAACLGVKVKDTIKQIRIDSLSVKNTLNRDELVAVQTPQVFKKDILIDSYNRSILKNIQGSDDSTLVERAGHIVSIVLGSYENIKVTTPEDFIIAERLLKTKHC